MTDNKQLKPCPFCDGGATPCIKYDLYCIECDQCGIEICHGSPESVTEVWNTRTPTEREKKLEEALRAIVMDITLANTIGFVHRSESLQVAHELLEWEKFNPPLESMTEHLVEIRRNQPFVTLKEAQDQAREIREFVAARAALEGKE